VGDDRDVADVLGHESVRCRLPKAQSGRGIGRRIVA
jgi:hypothetical protein